MQRARQPAATLYQSRSIDKPIQQKATSPATATQQRARAQERLAQQLCWRQARLQAKQHTIAQRQRAVLAHQQQRQGTLAQRHIVVQQRRASALQAAQQRRALLQQRWLARQRRVRAAADTQAQLRGRLATLQQALALEEAYIKGLAAAVVADDPPCTPRTLPPSLTRTSTRSTVWHLPRSLSGGSAECCAARPPAGVARVALALVMHEIDREAARQDVARCTGRVSDAAEQQRREALKSIMSLFVH